MKILYISDRLNADDGSSVHGREFVRALGDSGHLVVTYPPIEASSTAMPSPCGVRLIVHSALRLARHVRWRVYRSHRYVGDAIDLIGGYIASALGARRTRRLIRLHAPDLVVYRLVLFDFVPKLIRRHVRVPMIAEVNAIKSVEISSANNGAVAPIIRWRERYSYEEADGITVVSQPIRDFLLKHGVTKPIVVVRNGVDLSKFSSAIAVNAEIKKSYGLAGQVILGYVGSYQRWHGLGDSLRVLRQLIDAGHPVHFVLIGSGAGRSAFDLEATKLGLARHITQIDAVPHGLVPQYLRLIDIAVMTYPPIDQFYFSPLKLFEYLASGIPVVSSKLGQIEEILSAGDFGRLVAPGDIPGFVREIGSLVSDEGLRHRMGTNARAWAEANCSWRRNAAAVVDFGHRLIAERLKDCLADH